MTTSAKDIGQRARASLRTARTTAADEPETRPAALLRAAMVCKLAADLDDGPLARMAAREASNHARLLAGLDVGPTADLPDVVELIARRYPFSPEPPDAA